MANTYRGEVEFQDSEGKTYVLRLGTNQYISVQSTLEKLEGVTWQRFLFHTALTNGSETQKAITLEEAGDLIDDLGLDKVNDLIQSTRWGVMSEEARKKREAESKAALSVRMLSALDTAKKKGASDDQLAQLRTEIKSLAAVNGSGTANPPTEATGSNA